MTSGVKRHAGQLSHVIAGKLTLLSANVALMLLLSNRLNIEGFGFFVAAVGMQIFASRVLLLGVEHGMIRLRTVETLQERCGDVVLAGRSVILRSSGVLVLGVAAAIPILIWAGKPRLAGALTAGAMGTIGTALVDYAYSYRLAKCDYRAAGIIQSGTALVRLAVTAMVSLLAPADPLAAFFSFAGVSLASGMLLNLGFARIPMPSPGTAVIPWLLRYSAPQGAVNVAAAFGVYQGTFLLRSTGQDEASGVFGVSLALSMGFVALCNGFFEYLLSRVAHVNSRPLLRRFLWNSMLAALTLALACIPAVWLIQVVAPWFLKTAAVSTGIIFYLLAGSMILLLLQVPLESACHFLLRPDLVFGGWSLRVGFCAFIGLALAPQHGALGAAAAQFIAAFIGLAAMAVALMVARRGRTELRET